MKDLKFILVIMTLSFMLRLAFNFYSGFNASPGIDGIVLDRIAYHLATNQGYSLLADVPTAKKPPVFIIIIALIYKLFGVHNYIAVRVFLIIISGIMPFLVYLIAKNISEEDTARMVLILTAFSPFLIYNSWWFLSNTFMYFLLALAVYFLTLPFENTKLNNFTISGIFTGLATLSIQYGTAFYLPIPFIWAYFTHRENWLKIASVTALFMFLPVFLWMLRNYKVYDTIIYNNTESGIRFWGGNNPKADGNWTPWIGSARAYSDGVKPGWGNSSNWIDLSDKMGTPFQNLVLDKKGSLGEPEINKRYYTMGFLWIKTNPVSFVKLLFKKFYIFWHPFSSHSVSAFLPELFRKIAFVFELFMLVFFIPGIILSFRNWRKFFILYLLIAHQLCIALYSFGDIQQRMRIGIFIIIFSSLGILSFKNYVSKKWFYEKH